MAKYGSLLFCSVSSILILAISSCCSAADEDKQVYIVYMGYLPEGLYPSKVQHFGILQEVLDDSNSVTDTLIRSYKRSFNGFAAKLTDKQRQRLAGMNGVVSVFPSRTYQLHTTRSWDFMGLPQSVNPHPTVESDLIIGVIDTGIWPESESFNDRGFGPAPMNWNGVCMGGQNFTCNNKIIGARYYTSDNSARDIKGHGTHTASTVAGNKVKDASFFGFAEGTARGGVPSARIAAYKACSPVGCNESDILAAFDDAIADGVNIITISLGAPDPRAFEEDSIAIGAFHAMEKGILTTQSAGNRGPKLGTVVSVAPWVLSVAASSTDHRIINKVVLGDERRLIGTFGIMDKVVLGDGRTLLGNAVNSFTLNGVNFPLIYGKNSSQCNEDEARACFPDCLDSSLVEGNIVLCNNMSGRSEAIRAGALGIITTNARSEDYSNVVPLPESPLTAQDFDVVKSYMNSTKRPQGTILKSESVIDLTAPFVISFSSRGPNKIVPDILKPDVSAPGAEILAAYPPVVSPSDFSDKRSVNYSILSGTSMACPHAAAVAAYVKTFHPDWSPSAIKSAIMTTAWTMNASENAFGEVAYGSGHINPVKAVDPGLVYELNKIDYIKFLCSIGLDRRAVRLIAGYRSTCPIEKSSPRNLNYPSMAAQIPPDKPFNIRFHRTVTNVGLPNSTYEAKVVSDSRIKIKVVPSILSFESINEKKSFVVTAIGGGLPFGAIESSAVVWSSGNHTVRSPVVVFTLLFHPT